MIRRFLSPIALRLLLFNVLLVFLPIAVLFSLRSLEQQLLDLQERSMVQQGRLVAAALSAEPLHAEGARALIRRLGGHSEARIRIVDRSGTVIADSASPRAAPAGVEVEEPYSETDPGSRNRLLYRIGVKLWRAFNGVRAFFARDAPAAPPAESTPRDVIHKALAGRYGATLRESAGQRSLTLYSALPVRAGGNGPVIGAVMVSQSTSRILRALWRVRLDLFEVFALSVAVAVVLSLLMSATIAHPLIRLRNEADELLDHRGRLRRTFGGSKRRDEIGDLTRALEQLTARLERHLVFVESFSADVSHEFKNPLASIRNAAELLAQTDDQREREQLGATIEKEVARLNRLLNAVREVSKVDAAVDMEVARPVDLRPLLSEFDMKVSLPQQPVLVTASVDRLTQAFRNIVDNAVSFSRDVAISLREQDGVAVVHIDDEGPGIPPEHLERIFDRFFSFRPAGSGRDHDGLGLAIARAIVEGYGGTIRAMNRTPHGARIEVRLPVVKGWTDNTRMNRSLLPIALLLFAAVPALAQQAPRVTCESVTGGYRECRIGSTGKIKLVFDMSFGICQEGITWGTLSAGTVWIDRGCRGIFTVEGPDTPAPNRLVCESIDGELTSCRAETGRGVFLFRQLSRNQCIEGKTWGYDPERDTVWVSSGCRAEFGLGDRPIDLPAQPVLDGSVTCESINNRKKECAADTSGGVQLVRQLSDSKCIFGKQWGYDGKAVWVDNGCRAEFAVRLSRPMLQTVTCESTDDNRVYCPADVKFGVALARKLSNAACVLEETWGFEPKGIWVSHRCRAQFALGGFRLPASAVPANAQRVFCESLDGRTTRCDVDTGRGVGLVTQMSDANCVYNRTWGYDRTHIWVKAGCRAEFVVAK